MIIELWRPRLGESAQEEFVAGMPSGYSWERRMQALRQYISITNRRKQALASALDSAVQSGEITVHYQPQYEVGSLRLVRLEALARWFHPEHGWVSPSEFIEIAENTGLIVKLGEFVLKTACDEAAHLQLLCDEPPQLAVNVSMIELLQEGYVQKVAATLQRAGLNPSQLQLELTETRVADDIERAARVMESLMFMGVSIALDDFGKGHSNLNYLVALPCDTLKLDSGFIESLGKRPECETVVRSMISLARSLQKRIVVEGIETEEQLGFITRMHCDEVQGFLLGRPGPDATKWIPRQKVAVVSEAANYRDVRTGAGGHASPIASVAIA